MYILASSINMWFQTLFKQFFFMVDKIVYDFISYVYNLLIDISRTSIISQANILDMADRVYKLLAIFMIFKVTFSLITYVVNPDDFTDKSKGLSKLTTNIIISLTLLILTPYVFNWGYRIQAEILKDNSLATVIFGDEANKGSSFINSAGDEIAFITMNAFFSPNTSIDSARNCVTLLDEDGKVNMACSGMDQQFNCVGGSDTLCGLINSNQDQKGSTLDETMLQNYVAGVNNRSLGLMFRQDLAVATDADKNFIMDYKYIFSTVVGVVILLILVTYCMDIALRSIKLGFLQLVAPIPIISYVDPKSGKDGLFKKWYQMCFKTYASLFVRLIALYFAIYIIDIVADRQLVDNVDGTKKSGFLLSVFIIIGALMFAKQLPKILEGLGIKLDGDGKFNLNPLRKIENQALGGKLLKKPNDALASAAKGGFGLSTLGKKTIGGIDAARHGKGFKQGWDRTHGKLYNNFNKKLDEWAPERAEQRKAEAQAKANLHFMEQKEEQGRDAYRRAAEINKQNPSKGLEKLFSSPEYLKSFQNMNKAKGEMYSAQAKKQADTAAVEDELNRKQALYQRQLDNKQINQADFDRLNSAAIETAQGKIKEINKVAGTAEKRYEVAKSKHDEMKKLYVKDALLEDSFDYYDKTASQEEKDEILGKNSTSNNNSNQDTPSQTQGSSSEPESSAETIPQDNSASQTQQSSEESIKREIERLQAEYEMKANQAIGLYGPEAIDAQRELAEIMKQIDNLRQKR